MVKCWGERERERESERERMRERGKWRESEWGVWTERTKEKKIKQPKQ